MKETGKNYKDCMKYLLQYQRATGERVQAWHVTEKNLIFNTNNTGRHVIALDKILKHQQPKDDNPTIGQVIGQGLNIRRQ